MKDLPLRGYALVAIAAVVLLGFYASFHAISSQYLFYAFWDMDFITVRDLQLIQDGKIQTTLANPGYGLYFLIAWTHRIAYWLGQISFFGSDHVREALNPLLGVGELTDFLRFHEPFLLVGITLATWLSVLLLFPITLLQATALLVFLAAQPSLFYHATMLRSEVYAIFYWSLSLLAAACAARAVKPSRQKALVVLSGAFLGFCYLTKIQAVLYVAALPVFCLFQRFTVNASADAMNRTPAKNIRRLALANFSVYTALVVGAYFRHPAGATYVNEYPINLVGVMAVALPFVLLALESGWLTRVRLGAFLTVQIREYRFLHFLLLGFSLVFLSHFLLFANPAVSLKLMLLDAKMIFFRRSYGDLASSVLQPFSIGERLFANPMVPLLNAVLLAGVFRFVKDKRIRVLASLMTAVAYLTLLLVTRTLARDRIWIDILFSAASVYFLAYLWSARPTRLAAAAGYLALAIALVANIRLAGEAVAQHDVSYSLESHDVSKNFRSINLNVSEKVATYTDIMEAKFGGEKAALRPLVTAQAAKYRQISRNVHHVFPYAALSLKSVGLAAPGMPVWTQKPGAALQSIPRELEGAAVVDLSRVRLKPIAHRLQMPAKAGALAVLPRRDLRVYVALESLSGFAPASDKLALQPDYEIRVRDDGNERVFRVYRLTGYEEFETGDLPEHFWLIQENYS